MKGLDKLNSRTSVVRKLLAAKTDEEYLRVLLDAPSINDQQVIRGIEADALKRPKIQAEVMRILLRHQP